MKTNDQKFLEQVGCYKTTGQRRLERSILFHLAVEAGYRCYRCEGELDKDTFTIEHKEPWLDADNPADKFFNMDNIAFSHNACSAAASRGNTRGIPKSFAEIQQKFSEKVS